MTQCLQNIQKYSLPILQNSGRFLFQVGQYYECLDNPNLNYNFVRFATSDSHVDTGNYIGLCLPVECQPAEIKIYMNLLLQIMQLPFQVLSINNKVQDYRYPFNWVFYLTILVVILTLFLVILSTIRKHKSSLNMFSLQESVKIFKRNPNSNLNVLNGVRSLAMMWVVIGHSYSFGINGSLNLTTSVQKIALQPLYLLIDAGLFSVDVFFFVGGFLVSYLVLRDTSKNHWKYLIGIFQRFLRFWPSYLFAIMIYYSMYLHLGEGPTWGIDQQQVKWCQKIWKPLLFVDNLVQNGETQCMGWGWYLQNDMQLFIFSMFVMYLYTYNKIASISTLWVAIIGSLIFTFVWTRNNGTYVITHLSDFSKWGDFFQDVYVKPWARAPPYLIGLFLGILYVNFINQNKILKKQSQHDENLSQQLSRKQLLSKLQKIVIKNKYYRLIVEFMGIGIMLFLVMIPRTLQVGTTWSQNLHSLYLSLAKFVFVIGLSLTILPSLLGCKKSIIMFMMDTWFFNFIAKISFCTYLIHLIIMQAWTSGRTYNHYYDIIPQFTDYAGILTLSLFCGLIMTLLIEAPFAKLQKMFVNSIKKRFSPQHQDKSQTQVNDSSTMNLNKTLINS